MTYCDVVLRLYLSRLTRTEFVESVRLRRTVSTSGCPRSVRGDESAEACRAPCLDSDGCWFGAPHPKPSYPHDVLFPLWLFKPVRPHTIHQLMSPHRLSCAMAIHSTLLRVHADPRAHIPSAILSCKDQLLVVHLFILPGWLNLVCGERDGVTTVSCWLPLAYAMVMRFDLDPSLRIPPSCSPRARVATRSSYLPCPERIAHRGCSR